MEFPVLVNMAVFTKEYRDLCVEGCPTMVPVLDSRIRDMLSQLTCLYDATNPSHQEIFHAYQGILDFVARLA